MATKPSFRTFEDFFPFYVGQHSKAATRWVHLFGTLTGTAMGARFIAQRRWRGVALMPVFSYGAAWASHFLIEKNKPATWGHPLWSFRGDMKMIATMLRGRDRELGAIARDYKNTTPDASLPDQIIAA
ncbi:MAG: Mpo1-like protein [Actinomycetes bacterium]